LIEQFVFYFRQHDLLQVQKDHVDLMPAETLLPQTLEELMEARLDTLPSSTRTLLLTAAVLGDRFPEPWLSELLPETSATALPPALNIGFLIREGTHLRFAHALIRDVLYEMQLIQDRAFRHRQIASVLEKLGRTTLAALHRYRAWKYGEGDRAVVHACLTRALQQPDVSISLDMKIQLHEAMASVAENHEERLKHRIQAVHALDAAGDHETATRILQECLREARTFHLPKIEADARTKQAQMMIRQGEGERCTPLLEASRRIYRMLKDEEGLASVYGSLGVIAWMQGDLQGAHAHLLNALHFAEKTENTRLLASVYNNLANVLEQRGNIHEARRLYRAYIQMARHHRDLLQEARGWLNLASNTLVQERYMDSVDELKKAYTLLSRAGYPIGMAGALYNLAFAELELGHLERARAHIRRARDIYREMHHLRGLAMTWSLEAELHRRKGRGHTAGACMRIGLRYAHKAKLGYTTVNLYRIQAHLLLEQNQLHRALPWMLQAFQRAHQSGYRSLSLDMALDLAWIYHRLGISTRAQALLAFLERNQHTLPDRARYLRLRYMLTGDRRARETALRLYDHLWKATRGVQYARFRDLLARERDPFQAVSRHMQGSSRD
jgi:tetratricopeptide (TPR) repeat protein